MAAGAAVDLPQVVGHDLFDFDRAGSRIDCFESGLVSSSACIWRYFFCVYAQWFGR